MPKCGLHKILWSYSDCRNYHVFVCFVVGGVFFFFFLSFFFFFSFLYVNTLIWPSSTCLFLLCICVTSSVLQYGYQCSSANQQAWLLRMLYLAQSSVKDFLCSVVQWLPLGASLLELIFEVWLALFLPSAVKPTILMVKEKSQAEKEGVGNYH